MTTAVLVTLVALTVLSGCAPAELSGVRLVAVDPYEGRILDISSSKAVDVGAVPADQLPLRDSQINNLQTHAFVQNAAKLKLFSLKDAQDAATADRVISARWSPDGQSILLVLDASSYGNDVYEARIASPQLSTIRSARFRAPGFKKLANQGLALSWSGDGRHFAIGPREDRTGWTLVDPSKLGPADAPAVFIVDSESMERTAHPGYHSAFFLNETTLIASRGDRVLIVNTEFKELATVELPVTGRVIASDPQRSIFVIEATHSHASLSFGEREYWLVQHPSMRKLKLPRGALTLTFLPDAAAATIAPSADAGKSTTADDKPPR